MAKETTDILSSHIYVYYYYCIKTFEKKNLLIIFLNENSQNK